MRPNIAELLRTLKEQHIRRSSEPLQPQYEMHVTAEPLA
jgi:hypothetical protein